MDAIAQERPDVATRLQKQIADLVEDWALYAEADVETLCEHVQDAWDDLQRETFEPDDEPFEPLNDGDYPV